MTVKVQLLTDASLKRLLKSLDVAVCWTRDSDNAFLYSFIYTELQAKEDGPPVGILPKICSRLGWTDCHKTRLLIYFNGP